MCENCSSQQERYSVSYWQLAESRDPIRCGGNFADLDAAQKAADELFAAGNVRAVVSDRHMAWQRIYELAIDMLGYHVIGRTGPGSTLTQGYGPHQRDLAFEAAEEMLRSRKQHSVEIFERYRDKSTKLIASATAEEPHTLYGELVTIQPAALGRPSALAG
jgi:hypothetical protein